MPVARCLSQMLMSGTALALAVSLEAFSLSNNQTTSPVDSHLVVRSYRLRGQHARAIRRSLRQFGPRDQYGISRDAFTSWKIGWRWPHIVGGKVEPSAIRVSVTGEITLPRLSAGAQIRNPDWHTYHKALIVHELNHYHHALAGAELLAEQYRALAQQGPIDASRAHFMAREILAQVRAQDREYDRLTNHGESEGVRWRG